MHKYYVAIAGAAVNGCAHSAVQWRQSIASLWNDGGLGKEKAKENPGRQTNEYYYYILHHTLATSIFRGHTSTIYTTTSSIYT